MDYNVGDMGRLYMIYLNVMQILCEGVPGDFVELGVFRGNFAKVLAMLVRPNWRRLMLFDTFEGVDSRNITGVDKDVPQFFADTTLDQVQEFVGTGNTEYVKGFFPTHWQPNCRKRLPWRTLIAICTSRCAMDCGFSIPLWLLAA